MTNINDTAAVRKRPRGRMEEITAERLESAVVDMVELRELDYGQLHNLARAIALVVVQALAVDDSIEAVERMVGGW